MIGYLSASIEWASSAASRRVEGLVAGDGLMHYYVMGKDNITFHTVLWPAILMGAGDLPPT